MSADSNSWKGITPQHLLLAVAHIRATFETGDWKCSHITRPLCYAALHPEAAPLATLDASKASFQLYREMIGQTAVSQFEDLLAEKTPPARFRAYFDVYREGAKINVRGQFQPLLEIGLANSESLSMHPIEWAKLQLHFLIDMHACLVQRWIKETCDKQLAPNPGMTKEDFEEQVLWTKWRMPKLIHMQPAGNTPYDVATAWTRESETVTNQVLEVRSRRFVQFLKIELDKVAGDAHVQFAQKRENSHLSKKGTTEAAPNVQTRNNEGKTVGRQESHRPGALMSRYRSELKRGILAQLIQKPNATDLEVCRGLDADGAIEVPASWKCPTSGRLFVRSYSNLETRRRVEIAISKVRADLRALGLLDRR